MGKRTALTTGADAPSRTRAHAGKAEVDQRLMTILEWIVRAKPTRWKYDEAKRIWNIGERRYRVLESRVLDELRRQRGHDRGYDQEIAVAQLDALIDAAWEKGDREEARRATYTRWRITAAPLAGGEQPPPPVVPSTQVNINNLVIDMRGMSPIEKQRRLAQLEARRQRLLGESSELDSAPAGRAVRAHGREETDER